MSDYCFIGPVWKPPGTGYLLADICVLTLSTCVKTPNYPFDDAIQKAVILLLYFITMIGGLKNGNFNTL